MSPAQRLRTVDLAIVTLAAPIWVPILVLLGIAIVISSGRPILFRQDRVGRSGVPFSIRKFRSMTTGDNPLIPDPSYVTPIGRILRRTSLDELPQLLNVIDGSMSVVGPRPMLPDQADALTPAQATRHNVRPGLTGLAQVNGRNALSWGDRIDFDVTWATNPNVRSYLATLWHTIIPVISGDGIDGHDATDPLVSIVLSSAPEILHLDDFTLKAPEATPNPASRSAA